jgi:hypothetical protein
VLMNHQLNKKLYDVILLNNSLPKEGEVRREGGEEKEEKEEKEGEKEGGRKRRTGRRRGERREGGEEGRGRGILEEDCNICNGICMVQRFHEKYLSTQGSDGIC